MAADGAAVDAPAVGARGRGVAVVGVGDALAGGAHGEGGGRGHVHVAVRRDELERAELLHLLVQPPVLLRQRLAATLQLWNGATPSRCFSRLPLPVKTLSRAILGLDNFSCLYGHVNHL